MQLYPSIWAEEERNHLQPYTFYPMPKIVSGELAKAQSPAGAD